jgi:hypothetical protein
MLPGWPGFSSTWPKPGLNVSVAPPGADCQPITCGSVDGPSTPPAESCDCSSGEPAAAVQVLGVAPAMVSVTGLICSFAGSV